MNRNLKSFIFVALTIGLIIAVSVFPIQTGVDSRINTSVVADK